MRRDLLKYILGLLLFGSNGVVASFIHLQSQEIVLLRSILGGVFLLGLFFLTGGRFTIRQHKKDALFVVLSGAAMAADWLLLFEAYARIGVSLGMIINYCGPIIVIICSAFLFSEKITVKTLLALSAALIGAVLISWQGVQSGIDRFGLLLASLSAFAYAAMVILNKMSKNITGMQNATIQLTVTCVVVFLYVCVRNGLHITIPSESIVPVLWIGIINTGLGCFLYFSSISSLPAQTVSVCGYLEPLSAVLFSVLILHETMLPLQILGAVLILSGTMILNTKQKRQTTGRMTRQKRNHCDILHLHVR
ncbi:MAG: EamA family transporter [Oscillospiraceae bacterium]|nr:EamA family transporter [Oscillospiraceae bacterium]MBR0393393.1 EamA family transporter [Oscillospiraceae bacterium]